MATSQITLSKGHKERGMKQTVKGKKNFTIDLHFSNEEYAVIRKLAEYTGKTIEDLCTESFLKAFAGDIECNAVGDLLRNIWNGGSMPSFGSAQNTKNVHKITISFTLPLLKAEIMELQLKVMRKFAPNYYEELALRDVRAYLEFIELRKSENKVIP